MMWKQLSEQVKVGDIKALARCISLVESEVEGYEEYLQSLSITDSSILIGITGAPGSGKSTITDALIGKLISQDKKVAVLCIDPSSPFNLGALLGDRIRMSDWYNHPNVFIRSLATRGALGGLSPKTIEISDVLKAAGFDYIIVETVGVGQSEIEIAGLADTTIVVLIPDSGDDIQTMKSGLMEIADIFAVNKSDHPGADILIKNLTAMLRSGTPRPVIKTIATEREGITELKDAVLNRTSAQNNEKKALLMAEKAYQLLQNKRMSDVNKEYLKEKILQEGLHNLNLYKFVASL